jgi:AraC family transcriptional regulator of adaptative response/methylated-DNA-[protein]-cysteine methyltransferase
MNEELRWKAVVARDGAQDGRFLYGVLTTGIYCRPSCPSRRPLRGNVRFYDKAADAERDGLRPCKRCRPLAVCADEAGAEKIHALCRYIREHVGESLTLERLGARTHWSPYHLQRRFKAVLGVTPKEFVEACRLDALKRGLRGGASVTGAIYAAGFGSASRVYERAATHLGMTPRQFSAGAAGIELSYAYSETPLGPLLMGASDRGLCFVEFGDGEAQLLARLRAEFPGAAIGKMSPREDVPFALWMRALSDYLAGDAVGLDLPLDLRGTAFQMKVWNYLRKIPRGEVRSYGEVARAIRRPRAARAVAAACAANRVALLVPCHRVIRGDGGLGGYRWGLERKRQLIDRERLRQAGSTGKNGP